MDALNENIVRFSKRIGTLPWTHSHLWLNHKSSFRGSESGEERQGRILQHRRQGVQGVGSAHQIPVPLTRPADQVLPDV